jgi:hypothetical protein
MKVPDLLRHGRVLAAAIAAFLLALIPRADLSAQVTRTDSSARVTRTDSSVHVTRRTFTHASHTSIECVTCHTSADAHGQVRVSRPADCQFCHHQNATPQTCIRCHATAPDADRRFTARLDLRIAGQERTRDLPFVHTKHAATPCATCHSRLPSMAITPGLCQTCHSDHHKTDRNCEACHQAPPPTAHAKASHLTCGGAGCHATNFIAGDIRTRQVCLACHEKQRDHRPGERCVNCHVLPPFHAAGAAGP